jgi:hypothetical protein
MMATLPGVFAAGALPPPPQATKLMTTTISTAKIVKTRFIRYSPFETK